MAEIDGGRLFAKALKREAWDDISTLQDKCAIMGERE